MGLILRARIPAFLALLLVSAGFGIVYGMQPAAIIQSIQSGMGGTLGFVAVVVGLGAMLGALLDVSGGVRALSTGMLNAFGERRAPLALGFIGFVVAIPVFLDVALIILAPVIYGLTRRTGRPIVAFAIPLLAGLAVSHAFIPPTPGPIAVADILGADLGLVIAFGALTGLPAMLVAGPLFAGWLERQPAFQGGVPAGQETQTVDAEVGFLTSLGIVLVPLVLIVAGTLVNTLGKAGMLELPEVVTRFVMFAGHPFIALMIACCLAWFVFGKIHSVPSKTLTGAMVKALEPAGVVVLITGAGGAFKQILVDSEAGAALAATLTATGMSPLLFGFAVAAIIRVAQGSATVAMLTAAGIAAPVAELAGLSPGGTALMVLAIASGATVLSHVNDSGFWLVSRYLGLSEGQTLRSWTVTSTLVGLVGLAATLLLSLFV
ncbi:gluconate transporter [Hyphomonas johnsonii MHS-2]|uniref:Gluconate transporter n=1 Tax=Hyphomonas johnsonii MHS-2 TaxID=1280950 RepID=A0A059FUK6_9PROT|nr:gluconate transporter [Hyphomonas johnsonii MHS-2]